MAMRGFVNRSVTLVRSMEGIGKLPRYFSDGKGRVFSEEERAAETVYIKKMEREKVEKQKLKAEKEKAEAKKQVSEKLLEVLEKINGELDRDHAIRLDLLRKSVGVESAENYFAKLLEPWKNKLTYGALLKCYNKAGMTEKAMAHFEKMKELNFVSTSAYNNLMALYNRVGEPEKVLQLLEEMKEKDFKPDIHTYNFVMFSYGAMQDYEGVDKAMEEMKKLGVKFNYYTVGSSAYYESSAYHAMIRTRAFLLSH